MKVLIAGSGVIGTVYGAHLAAEPTVLLFGNNPGGRNTAGVALTDRIRQGFPGVGGVLQEGGRAGVPGRPRNLAVLHHPLLRPVAVGYWTRTMRSPAGELWFAAHCRHAQAEMRALAAQVVAEIGDSPRTARARLLLQAHP